MTEYFITNLKEMMKLAKRINDEDESLRIVDVPDEDTKVKNIQALKYKHYL